MKYLLAIIAILTGVLPAWANSLSEAETTLLSGQYAEAVEIGTHLESSEGYTLAASAIIAKIMTHRSEDIKDDAKEARAYAEQAIKLDSANAEAHLQYAVADGMVARSTGTFTAFMKKLPQKTKAAIVTAQTMRPEDPRGDALLGSWHLNVVRKAGAKRAEDMFDATADNGIAAYELAHRKAPNDIIITANYAMSLLALDAQEYSDLGLTLLGSIENMDAVSDIETVFQQWSIDLLANSGDLDTVETMSAFYLDGE